jgi:hypothetical protein
MPNGQRMWIKSPGGTIGRMDVGRSSPLRAASRRFHSERSGRYARSRQIAPGRDQGGGTRE